MRQNSTSLRSGAAGFDLRLHQGAAPRIMRRPGPGTCEPRARALARLRRARADRRQCARAPVLASARALAGAPALRATLGDTQLLGIRHGRREQHDLGAPPPATRVALGLMGGHAGGLQIVEPTLHALAMRTHEPRPLGLASRDGTPADDRRQADHELLERAREAS